MKQQVPNEEGAIAFLQKCTARFSETPRGEGAEGRGGEKKGEGPAEFPPSASEQAKAKAKLEGTNRTLGVPLCQEASPSLALALSGDFDGDDMDDALGFWGRGSWETRRRTY